MPSPSLSLVQERVIVILATGASLSAAAAQAGVHRNTIGNWRRTSPVFRYLLEDALYDRALLVREQAEALAGSALATIREILTDGKAAASVRLKAALAILNQACTPPPDPPALLIPESSAPTEPQIVHNSAQMPTSTYSRTDPKIGRNQPCFCGSGRKFKQCCLNKPKSVPLGNTSVTSAI
jgi:transposase-like protein